MEEVSRPWIQNHLASLRGAAEKARAGTLKPQGETCLTKNGLVPGAPRRWLAGSMMT